jgi:hypothetical protein
MSTSQQRIQAYAACILACEKCIKDCALYGYISCLELCRECSEFCTLGMRLEAQFAVSSLQFYKLCREVCILCSNKCFEHSDKHSSCADCFHACKMVLHPELFFD